MPHHVKQSLLDTLPDTERVSGAAGDAALATAMAGAAAAPDDTAEAAAKPLTSQQLEPADPGDLWPEAADARCSESAALFASTQPAPLSVV